MSSNTGKVQKLAGFNDFSKPESSKLKVADGGSTHSKYLQSVTTQKSISVLSLRAPKKTLTNNTEKRKSISTVIGGFFFMLVSQDSIPATITQCIPNLF